MGVQTSERGGVDGILFVFSLPSYDQVLFEDGYTDRWITSFDLFEEQCRYKQFENTHFFTISEIVMNNNTTTNINNNKSSINVMQAVTNITKTRSDNHN